VGHETVGRRGCPRAERRGVRLVHGPRRGQDVGPVARRPTAGFKLGSRDLERRRPSDGSLTAPAPSATDAPVLRGIHALIAETIANDRPLLHFELYPDRLDGSWVLDGNADDGAIGPGGPPPPVVTRADPLYSASELGALLVRIYERLKSAGMKTP
jgi:hypothetical protein